MLKQKFIEEFEIRPPYQFMTDKKEVLLNNGGAAIGYCNSKSSFYAKMMTKMDLVRIDYKKLIAGATMRLGYVRIQDHVFNAWTYIKGAIKVIDSPRFGLVIYERIKHEQPKSERTAHAILIIYNHQGALLLADAGNSVDEELITDVTQRGVFDVFSV